MTSEPMADASDTHDTSISAPVPVSAVTAETLGTTLETATPLAKGYAIYDLLKARYTR